MVKKKGKDFLNFGEYKIIHSKTVFPNYFKEYNNYNVYLIYFFYLLFLQILKLFFILFINLDLNKFFF